MQTISRTIVGAFMFSADQKVLLVKTAKGGVYQGKWIIPGGGVEPDESERDALLREVQEEVGLDISGADIAAVAEARTGESEKTLPETGERVLVRMVFRDFDIRLPLHSDNIQIRKSNELTDAKWFSAGEIQVAEVAEPTLVHLAQVGYVA